MVIALVVHAGLVPLAIAGVVSLATVIAAVSWDLDSAGPGGTHAERGEHPGEDRGGWPHSPWRNTSADEG